MAQDQNNQQLLNGLYPFLSSADDGNSIEADKKNDALLTSIEQKAAESIAVKQQFFQKNQPLLIDMAQAIANSYAQKGRLFTMGNGGSSCDAAHLAVEFQHPVTTGRPSLPAMNLCMDNAMISAVSNDIGAAHVFVRQIEAHARAGDVLVGFSTSGNSDNLIQAFGKARQMQLVTIGFAGGNGGEMLHSGLLDYCLCVETDSIHRVQEVHVCCYHILWDLVHTLLAEHR